MEKLDIDISYFKKFPILNALRTKSGGVLGWYQYRTYILKCFVLIDLKTSKITHQDVGQMDMYVRMYDQLKRGEGDNPTLGIVLCSDTDSDIAKYSILHGNEQLFATKYRLCLPSDEELRKEIEVQKQMFIEQHTKD